jgi:hypothetical protein
MEQQKIVILHGFDQEEVLAVLRAVKAALPSARDAAFATSTPINMEWTLGDLLEHVSEEHRRFRESGK